MEHDDAIRLQAAERYVAHELSAEDQDAFEEHFFDCPECAESVRFELTFRANLREVLRESRPEVQPAPAVSQPAVREKWFGWFPRTPVLTFSFATNLALAAGLAVVLITGTRDAARPQFAEIHFAPGPAKGAEDIHAVAPGDSSYVVSFSPNPAIQSYSYEILNAAGKRESSGSLQAPGSKDDNLYLVVPVRGLPAGIHTLQVRGGGPDGEIVSRSRFRTSRE